MGKIKDLGSKIKNGFKSQPKSSQGKAFVRVVQFFAIMLVLTIFARGAAGATMPRVTTVTPHSAEISQSVNTSGTVTALGTTDVELPTGLVVKKIHAQQGVTVKQGANLIEFDMDAMNEELVRQELALVTLEIELKALKSPNEVDDKAVQNAQKSLSKAQSAYDKAVGEVNTAATLMQNAKAEYDMKNVAYQEVLQMYEAEAAKPDGERDDARVEELRQDMNNKLALREAAWPDYDEAFQAHAQLAEGLEPLAEALDMARETLKDAQEAYADQLEESAQTNEKNSYNITLKEIEIAKQKDLIATLKAALELDGIITAPVAGMVTLIPVEAGETITTTSYIKISTGAEGYLVECSVSQKDASSLQVGGKLYVKRSGNYYYGNTEATIVSKSVPDSTGNVTLRAQLSSTDWQEGEMLEVSVILNRQQYSNCVPISAVRSNNDGYYVFVLREESTILGQQTVARIEYVDILAQDSNNIAINYVYEPVLVEASKPVKEGDRVRVVEEIS